IYVAGAIRHGRRRWKTVRSALRRPAVLSGDDRLREHPGDYAGDHRGLNQARHTNKILGGDRRAGIIVGAGRLRAFEFLQVDLSRAGAESLSCPSASSDGSEFRDCRARWAWADRP